MVDICTSSLRALIVAYMVGCFPEKPKWCLSEQICQGSTVYSALNSPEDWILRYILYLFTYSGNNYAVTHLQSSGSSGGTENVNDSLKVGEHVPR